MGSRVRAGVRSAFSVNPLHYDTRMIGGLGSSSHVFGAVLRRVAAGHGGLWGVEGSAIVCVTLRQTSGVNMPGSVQHRTGSGFKSNTNIRNSNSSTKASPPPPPPATAAAAAAAKQQHNDNNNNDDNNRNDNTTAIITVTGDGHKTGSMFLVGVGVLAICHSVTHGE